MSLAFVFGFVGVPAAVGAVSTVPAMASGSYDNAKIAQHGLTYVGQYYGQCWTFARDMIYWASGGTQDISAAAGGGDYFAHLANAGGAQVTDINSLVEGDVVQIGQYDNDPSLHTFIIVSHVGGSTFEVVDANHNLNGVVNDYQRTVSLGSDERAFRFGTVMGSPSGTLWAITSSGQAMRYAGNAQWTNQGGPAFQDIAADSDGSTVVAVSTSGGVYTYQGNGAWHLVSGATVTDVADQNGTLWAINTSGQAIRYAGNGQWTNQGGPAFQDIAAYSDGSNVAAVSTSGGVYTYQGNGAWHLVSGATVTDVAVQ